jgi:carbonic anhydrase/acetyltransferase-like protein (isoleucine patch superfamily)
MSTLGVLLVGLLPASSAKNWLLCRFGWRIGADASIGPGIYLRVRDVSIGAGAIVGTFNVLRDLASVEIGDGAIVGQWNWISAAAPLVHSVGGPYSGRFRLGRHAAVTSRHYLDASGGIQIGEFTTMAGVRSTILTHGIDMAESQQSIRGCSIGDRALVSSNVKLVPGAHVPDESLVAMGAVVLPGLEKTRALYRGVPATYSKDIPPGRYFTREQGPVDLPGPYQEDGSASK